jgi:hypothetical protein
MRFNETSNAKIRDKTVIVVSPAIRKRRLSSMSVSAPEGTANRNIGRVDAVWTSDTISGLAFRFVMSHPEEALYIQVPMFDTRVTVQIIVNGLWRNATHAERAFGSAAAESLDLDTGFTA